LSDELITHWLHAKSSIPTGNCVELVALPDGGVAMRDSKNPDSAIIRFSREEWLGFKEFVIRDGSIG
jgi:uncharacterized protein DUF397